MKEDSRKELARKEFADVLSLNDLLVVKNYSFEVPRYQREYAWQEPQIDDLWTDMFDFWQQRDSGDDYLLGQVIVSPHGNDKGDFFVVDGQQRFTTMLLFFAAALEFANNHLTEKSAKEVKNLNSVVKQILFSVKTGKELPRLLVTEGGRTTFLNILGAETMIPASSDLSAQNILDNYRIFQTKFNEEFLQQSPSKFFDFLEMVKNDVVIIFVKLPSDEQALEFFERTNDRGMPLNQADLMKNLLFSQVSKKEYENISDLWSESVSTLREIKTSRLRSMDFALKALLSEESGQSFARKKVFREWRDKLKDGSKSPEEFLSQIGQVTKHVARIAQQDDVFPVSRATTGSRYLNSIQQWTVTSAARNLQPDVQLEVAEIVEARTVLSAIVRERSQDFERVISPWAKRVAAIGEEPVGAPKKAALEASKPALAGLKKIIANELPARVADLTYESSADRKRIKLILALVNREMAITIRHDTGDFALSQFLSKTYDIEHIEPQSRAGSENYNDENRYLVNSIGNLTLWYKTPNRGMRDASPSDKLSSYSQSSVLMTQALCPIDVLSGESSEDVNWDQVGATNVNILSDWGPARIMTRQNQMSKWLARYFERALNL